MENRRLFTFLMTSLLFLILWNTVIGPKFFPQENKKARVAVPQDVAAPEADVQKVTAAEADDPAESPAAPADPASPPADLAIPEYPAQEFVLGSVDPESGYALSVKLTSAGAAIEGVQLTSPQFMDLEHEKRHAQIVGNNLTPDRTFSTAFGLVDQQLEKSGQTLETAHWNLTATNEDENGASAIFEYEAPDRTLRIRKTYTLPKLKLTGEELRNAWREDASFYTLQVAIEMTNLSEKPQTVEYEMQGPVGLLLENEEHTSKYRDIHVEFIGDTKGVTVAAGTVQKYVETAEAEEGRSLSREEQFDFRRVLKEWS